MSLDPKALSCAVGVALADGITLCETVSAKAKVGEVPQIAIAYSPE